MKSYLALLVGPVDTGDPAVSLYNRGGRLGGGQGGQGRGQRDHRNDHIEQPAHNS